MLWCSFQSVGWPSLYRPNSRNIDIQNTWTWLDLVIVMNASWMFYSILDFFFTKAHSWRPCCRSISLPLFPIGIGGADCRCWYATENLVPHHWSLCRHPGSGMRWWCGVSHIGQKIWARRAQSRNYGHRNHPSWTQYRCRGSKWMAAIVGCWYSGKGCDTTPDKEPILVVYFFSPFYRVVCFVIYAGRLGLMIDYYCMTPSQ